MFEFPCGLPGHVAISTTETEPARIWHRFLDFVCLKPPTVFGVASPIVGWAKKRIVRFVPTRNSPKSSVAS